MYIFMNRRKRSGPRTLPCGTPLMTLDSDDWQLPTFIHCVLPCRKEEIHCNKLPSIPNEASFTHSLLWTTYTLSKALLKSMLAQSTELRVFSTNDQSFTHSISWLHVDRRARKPCCCVTGSATSDLL